MAPLPSAWWRQTHSNTWTTCLYGLFKALTKRSRNILHCVCHHWRFLISFHTLKLQVDVTAEIVLNAGMWSVRLNGVTERSSVSDPFQAEKQLLEQNLQRTEDNLSRQLTYAQQVSLPPRRNPTGLLEDVPETFLLCLRWLRNKHIFYIQL